MKVHYHFREEKEDFWVYSIAQMKKIFLKIRKNKKGTGKNNLVGKEEKFFLKEEMKKIKGRVPVWLIWLKVFFLLRLV